MPGPTEERTAALNGLRERSQRRRRVGVAAPEDPSDDLGPQLGSIEPRLWTPPLRDLTPATSMGFDWVEFAKGPLGRPADPWQEWAFIHGGELLPDGRPRFHVVLVIVARQNGKTEIPVILAPYWQFVEQVPLILGTSTKVDYARETWEKSIKRVQRARALDGLRPEKWIRRANGEQESWTLPTIVRDDEGNVLDELEPSRHKIAAANAEGGRSLTVNRLYMDELRQHHDYSAWDSAEPATSAVPDAQVWCLSNAGDGRSIVLNELRAAALAYIETGVGDPGLCLMEWSAPEDADPTDLAALAQANPNLGRRINPEALLAKARRAVQTGGEALAGFKTESMCIYVPLNDPAIDQYGWRDCCLPADMSGIRASGVAMCVEVSDDGQHATAVAAARDGDRVRIEVVAVYEGADATAQMRRALPRLAARVKPRRLGWIPNGPTAAIGADLAPDPTIKSTRKRTRTLPSTVELSPIQADVPAVCMGFAELVLTRGIYHSDEDTLTVQVRSAGKLHTGGNAKTWVFERVADIPCDAVYAAAGAVHLARTMPQRVTLTRIVTASGAA